MTCYHFYMILAFCTFDICGHFHIDIHSFYILCIHPCLLYCILESDFLTDVTIIVFIINIFIFLKNPFFVIGRLYGNNGSSLSSEVVWQSLVSCIPHLPRSFLVQNFSPFHRLFEMFGCHVHFRMNTISKDPSGVHHMPFLLHMQKHVYVLLCETIRFLDL